VIILSTLIDHLVIFRTFLTTPPIQITEEGLSEMPEFIFQVPRTSQLLIYFWRRDKTRAGRFKPFSPLVWGRDNHWLSKSVLCV